MLIRGSHGVPDDLGGKLLIEGVVLKADGFLEAVFRCSFERDFGGLAGSDFHLPDFALSPNHNMLVVWCPVIAGIHPKNSPGLLLILAQSLEEGEVLPGSQVVDKQYRLGTDPAHEGELFAIVGDLWAAGSARSRDEGLFLSLFPVVALDDINLAVRVFVVLEIAARVHVLAVVDVAAIRRNGRLVDILLIVLALGQLKAAAACFVVHPHLSGTQ